MGQDIALYWKLGTILSKLVSKGFIRWQSLSIFSHPSNRNRKLFQVILICEAPLKYQLGGLGSNAGPLTDPGAGLNQIWCILALCHNGLVTILMIFLIIDQISFTLNIKVKSGPKSSTTWMFSVGVSNTVINILLICYSMYCTIKCSFFLQRKLLVHSIIKSGSYKEWEPVQTPMCAP